MLPILLAALLLSPAKRAPPPQTPTRHEVIESVQAVQALLAHCRFTRAERLQARIVFGSHGRVERSELSFAPEEPSSEARQCAEWAVRQASLRPFQQRQFSVSYPFLLSRR